MINIRLSDIANESSNVNVCQETPNIKLQHLKVVSQQIKSQYVEQI